MMDSSNSLVVLGDAAVHDILINLSRSEILQFQDQLATCLAEFAIGKERSYQPAPGIINRPEGQKVLFRPFTSSTGVGAKIIVDPAGRKEHEQAKQRPGLSGMLAMCDANGNPSGIINAKEVTGYRTSMSAMIPFMWRNDISNIVIFGAGLQASWHARLALGLRGNEIKSITFVNRSVPRAQELVSRLQEENSTLWRSQAQLACLDTSLPDYQDRLRSSIQKASVIFCTVPSTSPLFHATHIIDLMKKDMQSDGPLVSGIGSWQADMVEIDPELVKHAVKLNQGILFKARDIDPETSVQGGAILVDDRETCNHSGEIVQSHLVPDQLLEIGDLVDRQRRHEISPDIKLWLESGLVIYKSVGVGLTDLVTGEAILNFAKKKQMGVSISDF